MEVINPRCGALDLGKDVLVAAIRIQADGQLIRDCRTYGTTKSQLEALRSWLEERGVTDVVMEATGSYWKPVWKSLGPGFRLTLANPAEVKNVPGRKSDVNDATWLVDLHAHGLIRGSFVPTQEVEQLRELTRTRKQLTREFARHELRIHRILDVADIKIGSVISDLLGVSGRAILRALIKGETRPERLAALAHPRLQVDRSTLIEALRGSLTTQQRKLLKLHLRLADDIHKSIEEIDHEIGKGVRPFRGLVARLTEVPGLAADVSIPAMLGEIGVDMSTFPTHRHLVSWTRLSPRLDQSAGKVHSRRTQKGALWIKTLMIQVAWCAVRTRNSYFRAQFFRLKARLGPKKAIGAVAAAILTTVYYMIRDGCTYHDLGANYFDQLDKTRATRRFVSRLEQLGFKVTLEATA
jgi:transposase